MPQRCHHQTRRRSLFAVRWRIRRGCYNAKRLAREATVLMSVHGAVRIGYDDELCRLLAMAGLGRDAATAIRFFGAGHEYGLILPTDRTWNQPRLRSRACTVGSQAATGGHRVAVVSPAEVRSQPRLANAQRIFHAKQIPAYGDLDRVTRHIEERAGEASLIDCAAALPGPNARERIFGLLFGGHIRMDLTTVMTDRSVVRLRLPTQALGWEALGWHLLRAGDPLALTS